MARYTGKDGVEIDDMPILARKTGVGSDKPRNRRCSECKCRICVIGARIGQRYMCAQCDSEAINRYNAAQFAARNADNDSVRGN